jgi:acyl-CoA reductase-like NAD-dependent aldehyde dehydrogenase
VGRAHEAIAAHPSIDMVSFTGSTRAGKRVSVVASDTVRRVALDLGGKSANVREMGRFGLEEFLEIKSIQR